MTHYGRYFSKAPPICVGDEKYLVRSPCHASFVGECDDQGNVIFINVDHTSCTCCRIVELKNPIPHRAMELFVAKGGVVKRTPKNARKLNFNVVMSYRKYYLEGKMHDMPRFTYTNRDPPRFILDAFPSGIWDQMWPVLRLILLGHQPNSGSIFSILPIEVIALIERYVLSWPFIGQGAIEARLRRESKKPGASPTKRGSKPGASPTKRGSKKPLGRVSTKRRRRSSNRVSHPEIKINH